MMPPSTSSATPTASDPRDGVLPALRHQLLRDLRALGLRPRQRCVALAKAERGAATPDERAEALRTALAVTRRRLGR